MIGNRILIINVNWIGDALFSTPFIRSVREANPSAYIACLIHPRTKEILDGNTRLDELIVYDEEGLHRSLAGKLKLIMRLRKGNFDTAFILHRSFTKALMARLAGVKELIGYPTKKRAFLLTKAVETEDEDRHKVEYFLDIARAAGIKPKDTSYEFFISDGDRKWAAKFLADNGIAGQDKLIVICPGGNWGPKRWPKENFAAASDILAEKLGARILISGASSDSVLADAIRNMMKAKPVIACGRTTLKQLAAIFERASLVIANDTGTMHLAVAMKAKTIALFGPTSWRITGPYGKGRYKVIYKNEKCDIPCYDFTCNDNECMKSISVGDVADVAGKADW